MRHIKRQILVRARLLWRKLIRLEDTPRRIAMGFAVGIFIGMSPYFGLHSVSAFALSWLLRANIMAALVGCMITNPVTVPFIYGFTFMVGQFFVGSSTGPGVEWGALELGQLIREAPGLFLKLTIGGVVTGLPLAAAAYWLAHNGVSVYHKKRQKILKAPR